ncbi:hypothetical protein [Candidatus Frankia alpina]|uniref:hypothetical protein n=1 Tax=Candidatus Frankia alpina TaxID=2699483 RepID=UPI0010A5C21E|nr:hypothetical protein [Candidatus Frankia alpina]
MHAIVGGTPAYRREFARDDTPAGPDDFDAWVTRTVLSPTSALFRDGRCRVTGYHARRSSRPVRGDVTCLRWGPTGVLPGVTHL